MKKEIENFTQKPISEFTTEDTLYIQKIVNDFIYTFLVKFVKFERGILTGIILDIQPNNIKNIWIKDTCYQNGVEISSRISKCYTYIHNEGCKWFKKEGKDWKCKK